MRTFIIAKVERNSFDTRCPEDPKALYSWGITTFNGGTVSSGFFYSSVVLLMGYFNVKTPSELAGKMFTVPDIYVNAGDALYRFLTVLKHKGDYKEPTKEDLYERAIESLAHMECPDFSNEDPFIVFRSFLDVWSGYEVNQDWFKGFRACLIRKSKGTVWIEEPKSEDDFKTVVSGPCHCYRLMSRNRSIKMVFGPYSNPFWFEE